MNKSQQIMNEFFNEEINTQSDGTAYNFSKKEFINLINSGKLLGRISLLDNTSLNDNSNLRKWSPVVLKQEVPETIRKVNNNPVLYYQLPLRNGQFELQIIKSYLSKEFDRYISCQVIQSSKIKPQANPTLLYLSDNKTGNLIEFKMTDGSAFYEFPSL